MKLGKKLEKAADTVKKGAKKAMTDLSAKMGPVDERLEKAADTVKKGAKKAMTDLGAVDKKIGKAADTVKKGAKKAAADLGAKLEDLPKTVDKKLEKLPGQLQQLGDKIETAFDTVTGEIDRVGRTVLGVRTEVVFEVQAVTKPGERVLVTGNAPELGDFRPEHALPLDGAAYPTWSGRISLVPGTKAEYKYVRANEDGSFTWETIGENRTLGVAVSGSTIVHDRIAWP
jgi:hypothetical protein